MISMHDLQILEDFALSEKRLMQPIHCYSHQFIQNAQQESRFLSLHGCDSILCAFVPLSMEDTDAQWRQCDSNMSRNPVCHQSAGRRRTWSLARSWLCVVSEMSGVAARHEESLTQWAKNQVDGRHNRLQHTENTLKVITVKITIIFQTAKTF